jgi:hypothetical protein
VSALPAHVLAFAAMTKAEQLDFCGRLLDSLSTDYCEACGGDGYVECDNGPDPETEPCEACGGTGHNLEEAA